MQRASLSSTSAQGNAASVGASLSADGRFVAFASDASNLVPGDTNFDRDVFVRDRLTGATGRISVSSTGDEGNDTSAGVSAGPPRLSADGRYVAFSSRASNLVPDDTNETDDVFVRDRATGTTERASVASDGTQGNGESVTPSISGDGRYVTFTAVASNLVPNDSNNDRDVFVHDRLSGVTELASVASDGTQGNFTSGGLGAGPARITADGRYVVFGSFASNLVPNDTNNHDDIFVRDRVDDTTERVSVSSTGVEGDAHSLYPSISGDGRYVVFYSGSATLVPGDTNNASDVFLHDRETGTTVRLSDVPGGDQGIGSSYFPVISADGRVVAFHSEAPNLAPGDSNGVTDVFLLRLDIGALVRLSVADGGSEGNGASSFVDVSADGAVAAFESMATNLVPGDTNGASDVFVWGGPLGPPATPTPVPTATPTLVPTPTAQPGDVNCDRTVNSIDAALVLQLGAALIHALPCPSASDVNGDGRTDAVDAALILQFVAGLLHRLPP